LTLANFLDVLTVITKPTTSIVVNNPTKTADQL